MLKKILIASSVLFISATSLFAVYDPTVAEGWKLSQQRFAKNHCLDTVAGFQEWAEVLDTNDKRENFCTCVSEQYLDRFTYKEFNTVYLIAWRKAGIETKKYDKPAIQSYEEQQAYDKVKIGDYEAVKYCSRPSIINADLRKSRIDYLDKTGNIEKKKEYLEGLKTYDEAYEDYLKDMDYNEFNE